MSTNNGYNTFQEWFSDKLITYYPNRVIDNFNVTTDLLRHFNDFVKPAHDKIYSNDELVTLKGTILQKRLGRIKGLQYIFKPIKSRFTIKQRKNADVKKVSQVSIEDLLCIASVCKTAYEKIANENIIFEVDLPSEIKPNDTVIVPNAKWIKGEICIDFLDSTCLFLAPNGKDFIKGKLIIKKTSLKKPKKKPDANVSQKAEDEKIRIYIFNRINRLPEGAKEKGKIREAVKELFPKCSDRRYHELWTSVAPEETKRSGRPKNQINKG